MADSADKLAPAEPRDLADAIAFALRFEGRKRVHNADEYMAAIASLSPLNEAARSSPVAVRPR